MNRTDCSEHVLTCLLYIKETGKAELPVAVPDSYLTVAEHNKMKHSTSLRCRLLSAAVTMEYLRD